MTDQTGQQQSRSGPSSADIARHVPLVHQVVRRMLRRLPANVRQEDLYSAGLVGLYDSIKKNGGDEGPKFEWYARVRIRGAILDELRSQDWLPRRARWVVAGRRPAVPGTTTLPSAVVALEDVGAGDLCGLADADAVNAESTLATLSDRATVTTAIDHLPERERTIVRLHYFEGVRFKDIGKLLGVSEPRISQLHARAIGRLRASMAVLQAAA